MTMTTTKHISYNEYCEEIRRLEQMARFHWSRSEDLNIERWLNDFPEKDFGKIAR